MAIQLPQDNYRRAKWEPIDLADVSEPLLQPSALFREDGRPLLYSGRINAVVGPPESGKTWLADIAEAEALFDDDRGDPCRLDWDGSQADYVAHLCALSVDRRTVDAMSLYWRFEEWLDAADHRQLFDQLRMASSRLTVVDGLTAAMALQGFDGNSNLSIADFWSTWLRPLQRMTDGPVLILDHTGKDGEWLGGMQKKALIDGVVLRLDVVRHFARGRTGEVRVLVEKDRPGAVRALAAPDGEVARFRLQSHGDGSTVTAELLPPAAAEPTTHADRIALLLMDGPRSVRDLADALGISTAQVRARLSKDSGRTFQRRDDDGLVELV